MFSGQHGHAQIVRRLTLDHIGRTGRRLQEIERKLHQVEAREVPDITIGTGGTGAFPPNPRDCQLVWRGDLAPPGFYKYNAASGNWAVQ